MPGRLIQANTSEVSCAFATLSLDAWCDSATQCHTMPHNATQCHTIFMHSMMHFMIFIVFACFVFTLFLHDISSLFPSKMFEVFFQSFYSPNPSFSSILCLAKIGRKRTVPICHRSLTSHCTRAPSLSRLRTCSWQRPSGRYGRWSKHVQNSSQNMSKQTRMTSGAFQPRAESSKTKLLPFLRLPPATSKSSTSRGCDDGIVKFSSLRSKISKSELWTFRFRFQAPLVCGSIASCHFCPWW